jgi:hypothetical protein
MKKIWVAVLVMSVVVAVPVMAEEAKKEGMPGMPKEGSMEMSMPGMGKKCGPMMGKAQMVATDEGGVIVLAGNKLMKYNADLDLVKEVEIKMPIGPMDGKQCPMMGKMMEKNAASSVEESSEKTAS